MSIGNLIRLSAWTLAVLGIMSGCAMTKVQTSWSKPGAPPGEFERVSVKCEDDPGMAGLKGSASYEVCMQKHGWFLIEEPMQ